MKNRFVEIYESKPNQYINGAPLVINAGKLLFDNNSRKYVIQVKFQSITEKPISSVEICIEISNVKNEKEITKYKYLGLHTTCGQCFGSEKAIIISFENPCSFVIKTISVIYTNRDIESFDYSNSISVVASHNLANYFNNVELEKQYIIETNENSKFLPQEIEDIWICSCGSINKNDKCFYCNLTKTIAFNSLNVDVLQQKIEKRKKEEDEEKRRQAELKQIELKIQKEQQDKELELKSSREKKIKILCSILFSIVIIIILAFSVKFLINKYYVVPNNIYSDALKLKSQHSYSEAISEFDKIGDFKDSYFQKSECNKLLLEQRESLVQKYSCLNGDWVSKYEYINHDIPIKYSCKKAKVTVSMIDDIATLTIEFQAIHRLLENDIDRYLGITHEDCYANYKFSFNLENLSFISNYGTYTDTAYLEITNPKNINIKIQNSVYKGYINFYK